MKAKSQAKSTSKSWKEIALEEHLLDGVSDSPERMALLDRLFELFPDTSSRIMFLRYAFGMGLRPDSTHMVSIILLVGSMTRLIQAELSGSLDQSKEQIDEIQRSTQHVATAALQLLDRSNHFRSHTESAVKKIETATDALPSRFDEVVERFGAVLKATAEQHVSAAVEQDLSAKIVERTSKFEAKVDAIEKAFGLINERLKPIAQEAQMVTATEPIVVGRIKLNRVTVQITSICAIISGAVCLSIGLLISKPSPITITPQMVRSFDQGAAYARVFSRLTPKEQAAIARELSQP